jgi:hypothetical protein
MPYLWIDPRQSAILNAGTQGSGASGSKNGLLVNREARIVRVALVSNVASTITESWWTYE